MGEHHLNYSFGERRFGDVPKLVANIEKGTKELGWKVTKNLHDMCLDSYLFITKRDQYNKQKGATTE